MRVVIIGLVFAAIILAGGTAYLLRDYISSQQAQYASQKPVAPTTKVLVADADMPVGTEVNDKNTKWVDWPDDGVQDGYLVEAKDAKTVDKFAKQKYIARRSYTKGEPITMARLYKSTDPGFLRGVLKPGMRAVAVKSNAENSSAGFILPGDHIDIVLTHTMLSVALQKRGAAAIKKFKSGIAHTSETIIENLRVLAVDQNLNEFKAGAQVGKTVLLEVSPKDAEKLQTAKAMGKLTLVLRSVQGNSTARLRNNFTTDVEVSPMLSHFDEILSGKAPRSFARQPAPQASATPSKKPIAVQQKSIVIQTPRYQAPVRSTPTPPKKLTFYRGGGGTAIAPPATGTTAQ